MKIDLWLTYGLFVIFTSAILSFWFKVMGVIMILYIFLTAWYYVVEIKKINILEKIKK